MIIQILAPLLMMQAAPNAAPAPYQPVNLNAQERASLRCSLTFALISARQDEGNPEALQWPLLEDRGQEFFVQTIARIMQNHNLDNEQVGKLLGEHMSQLASPAELETIMPACLTLLETSGL